MTKLLSILCFMIIGFMANAQNTNPNAPIMKFVEETHDFGTLKEGVEATYDFEFTNTGKEPLIIQSCSASCGCTTPDWTKTPILPGKNGKIAVKYASKGHPGSFNKTIWIKSNAKSESERIEIYIKGNVLVPPPASNSNLKTNSTTTPSIKH